MFDLVIAPAIVSAIVSHDSFIIIEILICISYNLPSLGHPANTVVGEILIVLLLMSRQPGVINPLFLQLLNGYVNYPVCCWTILNSLEFNPQSSKLAELAALSQGNITGSAIGFHAPGSGNKTRWASASIFYCYLVIPTGLCTCGHWVRMDPGSAAISA